MLIDTTLFYNLVIGWIAIAAITFISLQFVTAPYGRHTKTTWGPMISNRWGWIMMELPALLICPIVFWLGTAEKSIFTWIFIGLWCLHYFNRTLVFPFRINTKGKKMPLSIAGMAIFFNLINGFICGYYLGFLVPEYDLTYWTDWRLVIGMLLFFGGMYINWQSDNTLINLRKLGETGYKIPRGGLFNWISCPNLFGEMVEWIGFALMTWSLPTFSFAIWTIANLLPRALNHHQWYLSKFENYPKERKAVIPFIW